jgi:hypothetical protein
VGVLADVGGSYGVGVVERGNAPRTTQQRPLQLGCREPLQERDPAGGGLAALEDGAQRDEVDPDRLAISPVRAVAAM